MTILVAVCMSIAALGMGWMLLKEEEEVRIPTWLYNLVFRWLHRSDMHVRVWQDGEQCSGCDDCPLKKEK